MKTEGLFKFMSIEEYLSQGNLTIDNIPEGATQVLVPADTEEDQARVYEAFENLIDENLDVYAAVATEHYYTTEAKTAIVDCIIKTLSE